MNQNTFRILVGETAKGVIDPSYIEELNQTLSQARFGNITFERVGRSGSVQLGKPVNLSGAVNIIASNPEAAETQQLFGQNLPKYGGRATRTTVTDVDFQRFISSENLVDKISKTARSQLFVSPNLLQRIQGSSPRERLQNRMLSLAIPIHEIGHGASFEAGLFDEAVKGQKMRTKFVEKHSRHDS